MEERSMRGRHPAGPEYVHKLQASDETKQRLIAILETLSEQSRVLEACERLGISEARFHELRQEALQGALDRMEPRPAGRPRRCDEASGQRIQELEQRVQQLEIEVRAAQVRAEINLALPLHERSAAEPEKKTTKPKRWQKKPT
jgi:hypothetical protein